MCDRESIIRSINQKNKESQEINIKYNKIINVVDYRKQRLNTKKS